MDSLVIGHKLADNADHHRRRTLTSTTPTAQGRGQVSGQGRGRQCLGLGAKLAAPLVKINASRYNQNITDLCKSFCRS